MKKQHDEFDEFLDSLPGKRIQGDRDPSTTKLYLLEDLTTKEVHFFDSVSKTAKTIGCTGPNISQRIKRALTAGRARTMPMSDAKMIDLNFKGFSLTVLIVPIIDVMEGYSEFFDEYEDNLRMVEEDDADDNR